MHKEKDFKINPNDIIFKGHGNIPRDELKVSRIVGKEKMNVCEMNRFVNHITETFDDDLDIIEHNELMYAQYLLQELVDDTNQPLTRRFRAALFVHEISHDQERFIKEGDLKPLFDYGGASVAFMIVDGFKIRYPDGTCTGTITERDFIPYVYDYALAVLNASREEDANVVEINVPN